MNSHLGNNEIIDLTFDELLEIEEEAGLTVDIDNDQERNELLSEMTARRRLYCPSNSTNEMDLSGECSLHLKNERDRQTTAGRPSIDAIEHESGSANDIVDVGPSPPEVLTIILSSVPQSSLPIHPTTRNVRWILTQFLGTNFTLQSM